MSHAAREAVIDRILARAMASFGRFKPTKAKAAKGITAAAAVKKAYPLYECAMLGKDALAVLSDAADDVRQGRGSPATTAARLDLVLAFLQHASGGATKTGGGVLLGAVTDLSAQYVRTACAQNYQDKLQETRESATTGKAKKKYSGKNDHVARLRQLAKKVKVNTAAAMAEQKAPVVIAATGVPVVSATSVRIVPHRACANPTQMRGSIVEHPEPVRGPNSAYHPLEVQAIIRTHICPKGTEHEWVGGKHNNRLREHVMFWLEKGWLGGGRLNIRADSDEATTLTEEGTAAFNRARAVLKRHYDKVEKHGWKVKLNYWSQTGRPRVMTPAERREGCQRLHAAGFDVEYEDWAEEVHARMKVTALETGAEDAELVRPPSMATVKAVMVSNDLNAGSQATKTGSTSTVTQTLTRQSAGESIRATHQLAAMVFAANYFPIAETHPRWLKFKEIMTLDDHMVVDAAGCPMIPVQACMLSSTDATSEWIQLNAGVPKVKFPAQRLPGRMSKQDTTADSDDETSDNDDDDVYNLTATDEAAIEMARARLAGEGDGVWNVPVPPPLEHGAAGAAPHHTIASRFDAVKQHRRKPANAPLVSIGANIALTFAAVRRRLCAWMVQIAWRSWRFRDAVPPCCACQPHHTPQNGIGNLTNPWIYVKGCSAETIPPSNKSGIHILAIHGLHGTSPPVHANLLQVEVLGGRILMLHHSCCINHVASIMLHQCLRVRRPGPEHEQGRGWIHRPHARGLRRGRELR